MLWWAFDDSRAEELARQDQLRRAEEILRRESFSPYGKFKTNYLHPARDVVIGLLYDLIHVEWQDLLWLAFFTCSLVAAVYLLYCSLRPRVVRGLYYVRGVQYLQPEAAVPGSPIRPGGMVIPSFMVEVYRPGLLIDTFMGYGIRIGEVLVMPMHVYASSCVDDRIILKGRNKISLHPQVIESRRCNDVAYSLLDVNMWAKLGTTRATVLDTVERSVPVTIFGREGTAAGYASKSQLPHVLTFSGSTLPGYSGSAYVSNGCAYGMHIGVAMEGNIGVSLQSVECEISRLIKGEKKRGTSNLYSKADEKKPYPNDKEEEDRRNRNKNGWDPRRAAITEDEEELYEQYENDAASRNKSFDAWLRGESAMTKEMFEAFSEMSITQLENVINLAKNSVSEKKALSSKVFRTQGPVGFEKVLQVSDDDEEENDALAWCIGQITSMRKEIDSLHEKIANLSVAAPKAVAKAFPCPKCDKSFTTKIGMLMHGINKHTEGESAFPADHRKTEQVVQTPFLGRTSPSPKMKRKNLPSTSSTSIPGVASTSDMSSLSRTRPSPAQLAQYLGELQKIISGLKEE